MRQITLDSVDFTDESIGEARPAWQALGQLRDADIEACGGVDRWPENLLEMEDAVNDVMMEDGRFFGAFLSVVGDKVMLVEIGSGMPTVIGFLKPAQPEPEPTEPEPAKEPEITYIDITPVGVQKDPDRVNRAADAFTNAQLEAGNTLLRVIETLKSEGLWSTRIRRVFEEENAIQAVARVRETQEEFLRAIAGR